MASATGETKYWWLKDGQLGIGYISYDSEGNEQLTAVDEVKTVRVYYEKKITHFTADLTETSDIPEQFLRALAYKVIKDGYESKPELIKLAQYFEKEWLKTVHRAREFKNRNQTKAIPNVRVRAPFAIVEDRD